MKHFFALLCLATGAASIISCGSDEKSSSKPSYGPKMGAVVGAAEAFHIDSKILLAAAFSQSNFGTEVTSAENLPGATRATPFSLHGDDTKGVKPEDLGSNAKILAGKIRELAGTAKPTEAFDWLRLTAEAIVGNGSESNLKKLQTYLVLSELISLYNNGFSTVLASGETIAVPKAAKPVAVGALDATRKAYLTTLSSDAVFGLEWPGRADAEVGEKSLQVIPKIVLRWCGASTLVCFDHLRYSVDSGSHLMTYRDANGALKFMQIHHPRQDLKWYGSPLPETVSITLTGFAGSKPETFRPEWFAWEDYVAVRNKVREILVSFARLVPHNGEMLPNSQYLFDENGQAPIFAGVAPVPAGSPTFALPAFWDSPLLRAIVDQDTLAAASAVNVTSPANGTTFEGTRVEFTVAPGVGTSRLTFDVDAANPLNGQGGWELVRKSEVRDGSQPYRFTEDFSVPGSLPAKSRAVRVTSRDATGLPTGFRVFRFFVKGM